MQTLVISCSLSPTSRSRLLARAAADELAARGHAADLVDVADLDLPPCDGASAYGAEDVIAMKQRVEDSDLLLLAAPVYNYDVNSAAKNLVELTGRSWQEKVVGFMLAAGGRSSYMSVMGLANSLMLDFRCVIVPRFVYATKNDFEDDRIVDEDVRERLQHLVAEGVALATAWGGRHGP